MVVFAVFWILFWGFIRVIVFRFIGLGKEILLFYFLG